jgi:hypothetical protein
MSLGFREFRAKKKPRWEGGPFEAFEGIKKNVPVRRGWTETLNGIEVNF